MTLFRTAILLLLALGCLRPVHADLSVHFPQNFRWCVASAAHQVEGGDTNSDWADWEQVPGHIKNGEKSGAACDEWNRVAEDIGLMKNLGAGVYRFSVEWSKIEPAENQYDTNAIAHYQHEVELLQNAGMEPLITLHHFTLPRWLRAKGGWEWDGSGEAFSRFAELVYREIAPGARDWVTFNEPMVHIMGGYYEGATPPGEHRSMSGIIPPLRGLLKAHAIAYHALHSAAKTLGFPIRVGMAHHLRTFDPFDPGSTTDMMMTNLVDTAWNRTVPDALESGRLVLHMLWLANDDEEIPDLEGTQDFLGVNYYTGDLIESSLSQGFIKHNRSDFPKNDLGWDIYPEGFYRVLHTATGRYANKPIIITENGIADAADSKRPAFLRDHLSYLAKAIDDGIPVEGYCHWSLMDNFEWTEGFTPRFGLYSVDYQTFARTPRPSAGLFHDIIANGGF